METKIMPKNAKNFHCEKCDFTCSKESNWLQHTLTRKHKMEINGNARKEKNAAYYECKKCNIKFKTNSGLWKHNKKCSFILDDNNDNNDNNTNNSNNNIIIMIIIIIIIKSLS